MANIPKYLLYAGSLRMSWSVDYHLELLPKDADKTLIKGGGRMDMDKENKKILFYGLSVDFGPCKKEDFIAAVPESWFSHSLHGYKIYWATQYSHDVAKAWTEAEYIGEIDRE